MPLLVVGGVALDEAQRAAGLEPALRHVSQRIDSLAPRGGFELGHCDQLPLQVAPKQAAVANEHVGAPFQLVELPVVVQRAHQHAVDDEQHRGAEQPAC